MTYPVSPANNTTTTINGVVYIYNSSQNSWTRVPSYTVVDAAGQSAGITANAANNLATSAYAQANAGTTLATAAFLAANTGVGAAPMAAYTQANAATSSAQAAYNRANTIVGGTSIVAMYTDRFTGDGTTTAFTMNVAPASINNTTVNYNGSQLLRDSYSVVGTTITFSSPPASNSRIEVSTANLTSVPTNPVAMGADTQVQYNDGGTLNGKSTFTFNKTTNTLSVDNINLNTINLNSTLVSVNTKATNANNLAQAAFDKANNGLNSSNTITISTQMSLSNGTESLSTTTGTLRITGGIGATGNINASNVYAQYDMAVGLASGGQVDGSDYVIAAIASSNNYMQNYIVNRTDGTFASADWVAYPNNGSSANGYIDVGINSLSYNNPQYGATGKNEGYIIMSAPGGYGMSGNLVIATDTTGTQNSIEFYPGGLGKTKGAANVIVTTQTTASSTQNGTLQVKGGLGVTGAIYASQMFATGLTTFTNTTEVLNVKTNTAGGTDYDVTTGLTFYHKTPQSNIVPNFLNLDTTDNRTVVVTMIFEQGAVAYYVPSVTISGVAYAIKWLGGVVPTPVANRTEFQTIALIRQSATWNVISQMASYG